MIEIISNGEATDALFTVLNKKVLNAGVSALDFRTQLIDFSDIIAEALLEETQRLIRLFGAKSRVDARWNRGK